jgi:DNA-binding XRE family transcriptional regulator
VQGPPRPHCADHVRLETSRKQQVLAKARAYDLGVPRTRSDRAAIRAAEARALGRRVAEARVQAGKSQAEAARALSVPQSQIAKVELGLRQLRFTEGLRLARLYAVAPSDLDPSSSSEDGSESP